MLETSYRVLGVVEEDWGCNQAVSETSLNMRNKEKVESWRRSNDYERKVFF